MNIIGNIIMVLPDKRLRVKAVGMLYQSAGASILPVEYEDGTYDILRMYGPKPRSWVQGRKERNPAIVEAIKHSASMPAIGDAYGSAIIHVHFTTASGENGYAKLQFRRNGEPKNDELHLNGVQVV